MKNGSGQEPPGTSPWLLATLLAIVALIGASFLLNGHAFSGVLRMGAAALSVTALVFALRHTSKRSVSHQHGPSPRGKILIAFMVGAIATYGAVNAESQGPQLPEAFEITLAETTTNALPVTQTTFEPSEEELEALVAEAAETAEEIRDITGGQSEQLVSAAQHAGYQTRSGQSLNWAAATTQSHRGVFLITTPLLGEVLPEISKVVFMYRHGNTTVVEMVGRMLDEATVHLDVWQDGAHVQNVDMVNPSISESGEFAQVFSWSELNRCLSNAGIAWWILSAIAVTCAAVCAATAGFGCAVCIAGLAGGNVGMATACVQRAMRA